MITAAMWLFSACGSSGDRVSFSRDVKPILNANCLSCHGGVKKMGGLSLLFEEDAFQPAQSGNVVIERGDADASELFNRLIHSSPEKRMPKDGDALSADEIDIIRRWIDQGAKWEKHWAYIPPQRPEPPHLSDPWIINQVDAFILLQQQNNGLTPSSLANPAVLARRVSMDLIGLPPVNGEADVFLADPNEKNYLAFIDTLLSSAHFGERWASWWLDLARYADSKGYERDPYRSIWRYRDWVIDAFNQDMPFDTFTVYQLAGDLIDEPETSSLLATAFHRNSMTNVEGGTDDEEFRVASVIDRVNTTFEVWQATTMSCVQCHSHPYDPFRHEDFFKAYAFFNNTQDADMTYEMPYLHEFDSMQIELLEKWLDTLAFKAKDRVYPYKQEIKKALMPRFYPYFVDDFEHVIIYKQNTLSNWSMNVMDAGNRKFYFAFNDIDLDGVKGFKIKYAAGGDDCRLDIRLNHRDAPVIGSVQLPGTGAINGAEGGGKNNFEFITVDIPTLEGTHDLVFQLINTTGKTPDGIAVIAYLEAITPQPLPGNYEEMASGLLEVYRKSTRTPVMKANTSNFQRSTHVFERGNWLVKGEEVEPGLPSIFHQQVTPANNRLDLAHWLVSDKNPLTARVLANRIWEQLMGKGLVETVEDFGTQGTSPTHPELLDYLAIQLQDSFQWRLKPFIRYLVTSATYRQSSRLSPDLLEKDPQNQWYARAPRFRLPAEQIRDQALAVSGLLRRKIGGKSVMPPQPDGVWQIVYSGERWQTEPDDRYRRGLYTYWKRTTPYPSMIAFDSPSREFCVSRRIRTNTPLQALVTLNDPVYMEAADALANYMLEKEPDRLEGAIAAGYYQLFLRKPGAEQLNVLTHLYQEALAEEHIVHPVAMKADTKERINQKALTMVASALMNTDAFLMKE